MIWNGLGSDALHAGMNVEAWMYVALTDSRLLVIKSIEAADVRLTPRR